ncbi:MAG: TOBE domain-containing protein, partial [Desulfobacterales bacterium]
VAQFVGECNIFKGRIRRAQQDVVELEDIRGKVFKLKKDRLEFANHVGKPANLVVRPEDIQVGETVNNCVNRIQGRVREKLYTGSIVRLVVEVEGEEIIVDAHKGVSVSPPDLVEIGWNPEAGSLILQD